MEVNAIDNLYKRCSEKFLLARQGFSSINDFQEAFQLNNQETTINLLNLTCVDGNVLRPKELWEAIHKLDDNGFPYKDFLKDLNEFSSLSFLLSIYPHFCFRKSEKPDFILKSEDKLIGLEVTSAFSNNSDNIEAQVNKIARFNFGRNKSVEEVQEYADKKHPGIANKYSLDNINGKAVLSPSKGSVDCHAYKNVILDAVLGKVQKVKNYLSFSEMWVLIDTENNVCFTEQHDVEELSNLFIKRNDDLVGINKIIVINVINKAYMFYDVESHEFTFMQQESAHA